MVNAVRELRLERGLTQAALARAAGITRKALIAIEAGRATPGLVTALRLCRSLDVPVATAFVDAGTTPSYRR